MLSSNYGKLLKDLQFGYEEGERPVQDFLLSNFGILTDNVGSQHVGWDLEVTGVDNVFLMQHNLSVSPQVIEKKFVLKFGRTIEVKRDKVSDRTGNFFYEVWSNLRVGNAGCIAQSRADTLVIVRNTEFIFVSRGFFISWVVFNLYHDTSLARKWKRTTCGEIRNPEMKSSPISPNVRGILIPIEDIKKHACLEIFRRGDEKDSNPKR